MQEKILLSLVMLGVFASLAQWFAWWVKLPAILFLLVIGIGIGPILGIFQPDAIFGELLFPMVSLSVAIILFEGSLTLNFQQIKGVQRVVWNMVTIGALVTWLIIATATHYIMDFTWPLALLFGALVVVTGPTVITPMLRTVRPTAKIANILRWEGIMIDPLGALLAVLVFDFIISSQQGQQGFGHILWIFSQIVLVGTISGALMGQLLGIILRRHWLPEYLHNMITLSIVFVVFAGANHLQHEAGLLAVTVMGMWLANMRDVAVDDILDFKENLSLLLISGLFIILAARLDISQLQTMGWGAILIFMVIQFIARPMKVLVSTVGSSLNWRERALLAWIAPRGIVAAAVSALFALRLESIGFEQAPLLVSLTFMVIIGTVVLQSATARPLAIWLGVAEPEPKGILIVGANLVARRIAKVLNEQGFQTLLTDSTWANVQDAKMAGLDAFWGNAISERASRHLDLVGMGYLWGLSPDDHLNVLASQRYAREFGRHAVYTLPPIKNKIATKTKVAVQQRGNILFNHNITYSQLASCLAKDGEIKASMLTEHYGFTEYLAQNDHKLTPLFAISPKGLLTIFGNEQHQPDIGTGWTVVGLVLCQT